MLGAIGVVLGLVPAFDDGEGVHDVGDDIARGREIALEGGELVVGFVNHGIGVASGRLSIAGGDRWQIKMEEGSVEFATEDESAGFVPAERRDVVAAVAGKGLHVPCGGPPWATTSSRSPNISNDGMN